MKPTLFWQKYRIAGIAIVISSALLAWVEGGQNWWQGFLAYIILLSLCVASLFWAWKIIPGDPKALAATITAFLLRLGTGVLLAVLLPVYGYADNEEHHAGYVFTDAFIRDQQAWKLAISDKPILTAFSGEIPGDQYGGMLALSASVYRYLSPAEHRPFLMLILTSTFAAWGVLFMWQAGKAWFGGRLAVIAGWIFAIYPESVLLGSSQMREPVVISAVAMAFYSLTQIQPRRYVWLGWLAASTVILLLFQPLAALVTLVVLLGLWFFDPHHGRSITQIAIFIAIMVIVGMVVVSILGALPSLQSTGPFHTLIQWLQGNFAYQSYLAKRTSGMLQMMLETVGEQWKWLIVIVYGTAQPVLPAVVGDPEAAWIMRTIGFLRAAGWYMLVPFLIYAVMASLRASGQERNRQIRWLCAIIWSWVVITALNGGADQWDTPRYRTLLLAWEAIIAAWAWEWARNHQDAWLKRWIIVESAFVLMFTEWYLGRYYPNFLHLSIWVMIPATLLLCLLILLIGWLSDRRKRAKIISGR